MKLKKISRLLLLGLAALIGLSGCADRPTANYINPVVSTSTSTSQPVTYSTTTTSSVKDYTPPIKGYGKISKTTGRVRTKVVSGHWRHTSKGYTYVRPYARS